MIGLPRIHHGARLGNREYGPLRELVEVLVGNDGRDFDDGIGGRIEAGHLQVDPDQVAAAVRVVSRTSHSSSLVSLNAH